MVFSLVCLMVLSMAPIELIVGIMNDVVLRAFKDCISTILLVYNRCGGCVYFLFLWWLFDGVCTVKMCI